jgi:hypothetical protein
MHFSEGQGGGRSKLWDWFEIGIKIDFRNFQDIHFFLNGGSVDISYPE